VKAGVFAAWCDLLRQVMLLDWVPVPQLLQVCALGGCWVEKAHCKLLREVRL
jgi:hypothetical protein